MTFQLKSSYYLMMSNTNIPLLFLVFYKNKNRLCINIIQYIKYILNLMVKKNLNIK